MGVLNDRGGNKPTLPIYKYSFFFILMCTICDFIYHILARIKRMTPRFIFDFIKFVYSHPYSQCKAANDQQSFHLNDNVINIKLNSTPYYCCYATSKPYYRCLKYSRGICTPSYITTSNMFWNACFKNLYHT